MLFRHYYLGCLSHASYLIGDTSTGRAVVVDPQRDVEQYVEDARANGLRIERVIETHFHADFLSGHLELAELGATITFGAAGEGKVEYDAEFLRDGDVVSLGDVTLTVLETPGHTPESISLLVREHASDEVPYAVLTGDTLFIGDVGRPDLLSSVGVSADDLARQLYHSLREKLLTLPDETLVFPAHGAGSACGKHLSTETQSTIGEQRRQNYALRPMSEDQFVDAVLQGQAAAPLYFAFSATQNRQAHALLDEEESPRPISFDEMMRLRGDGAAIVDARDDIDFAAGHVRGSVNVGLGGRFAEYCGEVIAAGTPIVLIAPAGHETEARVRLARIGFDTVVGALADPVRAFLDHQDEIDGASRLTATELGGLIDDELQVVDVRGPGETELGIVPGALVVPLAELVSRLEELDRTKPVVAYCTGGYRSSIAASVLRAAGFADVSDLLGGYAGWVTAGLPVA
ncbi:MAG TPA: rhodanese-like domain-containing protein [Acidimicrobiales bacterium]|nr:rhodanese-like domain-containing protein [Acidimicrobiales bacterium]